VLANEAQALAASDLAAARTLWQRAGEKYQQALTIKPDKYDAALNWGVALADEAQALAASDLPAARALWQQAGEKYQQALAIEPDDESAHFGSACVWALLGQVQECCSSLARWRKCKLDAKRSDLDASLDFDSVRNIPEFRAFRESLPE
jgi:tetratricopeptide (TPR) repeat protein